MSRTLVLCGVGLITGNEVCGEFPAYRVEARTYDGRGVNLYLCADHMHRSWQLAQIALDKKFPGQDLKVRAIHLHHLPRYSAAEAS